MREGADEVMEGAELSGLQYLKEVSHIKHRILEKYLMPWTRKLGSSGQPLCYVDCFAGPGRYRDRSGITPGSPVIAVRVATEYCNAYPRRTMFVILIESKPRQVERLKRHLSPLLPYPANLRVSVRPEDSARAVPDMLARMPPAYPAFFMIDPYGHPLSVPVINDMLRRDKAEVFINLMYYRIHMDVKNAAEQPRVDQLFGNQEWRSQPFMHERGWAREQGFLSYFISKLDAKYVLPFRILFDAREDDIHGRRTKYYLLHASNDPNGVLLMKEVMWPLGDELGTFDYSGSSQGILISRTPHLDELRAILLRRFAGRTLRFDELRAETWELPFIEKHYRAVLRELWDAKLVEITPSQPITKTGRESRQIDRQAMVRFRHD
jgi:three-Cys-motif partner protein